MRASIYWSIFTLLVMAPLLAGCGAKIITIPDSHSLRPEVGNPNGVCMDAGYLKELHENIYRAIDACK